MNTRDISLYLRQKKSPDAIKRLITKRIKSIAHKLQNNDPDAFEIEIKNQGDPHLVTATQFIHLLNDFINGEISKFELYFILSAIDASDHLVVENPDALSILFELTSPVMKQPISIQYIKSVIYRPWLKLAV